MVPWGKKYRTALKSPFGEVGVSQQTRDPTAISYTIVSTMNGAESCTHSDLEDTSFPTVYPAM